MHQEDIEQFAFWYLCGDRDRALLQGKAEMGAEDFERLTYLSAYFGMGRYSARLWKQFGMKFEKNYEEINFLMEDEEIQRGVELHEAWIDDFCRNAPSRELETWLRELDLDLCLGIK